MSLARVDYRIRPAKYIERHMLCDIFRCLNPFGRVELYRYLGFGGIYFADFILMHKMLGITNMLSMERDADQEPRHNFNRPYKCIRLDFRSSQEVLASIEDWDVRTIAWLDYTDKLDNSILADIEFFIGHAYPGSVLVVTVNCHPDALVSAGSPSDSDFKTPLERLASRVGMDNVPPEVTDKDLTVWGLAAVQSRIIDNSIAETLQTRNGMREPGTRYKYQQLMRFAYQDGLRMMTGGGLVFQEGQESILAQCAFEKLSFYRAGQEFYRIETPLLTPYEKRYLDAEFPISDGEQLTTVTGIPQEDIAKYKSVYRYFPTFIAGE